MSSEFKKLNTLIATGNVVEFNQLINNLKKDNKINDEIYFKYLGVFHLKQENLNLAKENLVKLISINSDNFDNHLNLAVCYLKLGEQNSSIQHFEASLKLKDDFPDTYILYSRALKQFENDTKAIAILKAGLSGLKNNVKIIFELAEIYREKREFLLAIPLYNQLIKKNPQNYVLYNSLAVCYENIGENVMAETSYLKAIKIKPDYFYALSNYGNYLTSVGNKELALNYFERCLALKENVSRIFRYISILYKFKNNEDHVLKKMLEYESSKEFLHDSEKYELYFALSKAYEDLNDHEKFAKYLLLANQYKRNSIPNSKVKKELEYFEVIQNVFSKNAIQEFKPELDGSNVILIIGMPRSGTTLVEQILGSHKKVKAGGEQIFFQNILRNNFDFFNKDKFIEDFKKFNDLKNKIGNEYLEKIRQLSSKHIVTDKLPFNFFYIGFFLGIFRNIKIINLSRNSMDNCFSIYKNYFPEDINFAYDQDELSEYYLSYKNLMQYWNNIFKDKIFNLKYEDLVSDQKKTTEKLLKYCNLEWDDNCLNFYASNSSVKTLSAAQVRNPIYKSSVKSWEKHKLLLRGMLSKLKTSS